MLNACHIFKNVWHVATDPLGRLNIRWAYSAAEGIITSPPDYPQHKPSPIMKNGQDVSISNLEHHKKMKMAYDVTPHPNTHWSALESRILRDGSVSLSEEDEEADSDLDINTHDVLQKQVSSLRLWQWTTMGHQHRSSKEKNPGLEFTLMSYNILSQNLLEDNRYLYKHCRNGVLRWSYRKKNLIAEMKSANADIICLQEMQEDHYLNEFKSEMKLIGYESLFKKRTGDKNDGCAIFFKDHMFSLDSQKAIEYYQPGIPVLDRDNIGLIAVLRPHSDTSAKLCVATTHLLFNPRRGDVKLAQLQVLLAELDKAAFKETSGRKVLYHPCIMCGDMNSEPFSPLYNFLTRGILHYYGIQSGDVSGQREGKDRGNMIHGYDILLPDLGITTDCQYASEVKERENAEPQKSTPKGPILEHGFRFESAYSHTNANGTKEVTTHHTKANCTVDYILFSAQHLKTNPLCLLGTMRLLSDQEVTSVGGLPNMVLSSDHLALAAKFFLKKL